MLVARDAAARAMVATVSTSLVNAMQSPSRSERLLARVSAAHVLITPWPSTFPRHG